MKNLFYFLTFISLLGYSCGSSEQNPEQGEDIIDSTAITIDNPTLTEQDIDETPQEEIEAERVIPEDTPCEKLIKDFNAAIKELEKTKDMNIFNEKIAKLSNDPRFNECRELHTQEFEDINDNLGKVKDAILN